MGESDILALLIKLFKKYRVSYVLTGSLAGSYWGHPRATHDIDFVVEVSSPNKNTLLKLLRELGPNFEVDLFGAESAIERHGQFNVIHPETLLKIDFWIAKDNDFTKNTFKRKVVAKVFGKKADIVSAEDLILTKLTWVKEVYSDKHFRDCVGILEMQKGKLNEKYLEENAEKLGVTKLLQEAREGKYY